MKIIWKHPNGNTYTNDVVWKKYLGDKLFYKVKPSKYTYGGVVRDIRVLKVID